MDRQKLQIAAAQHIRSSLRQRPRSS